jgi:uncharacterized protein HemX
MFKDYSGSISMANSRSKIRTSRRKSYAASAERFPVSKLMWKTISAMLVVTLVLGISSTVWYGLQVQDALDQIGNNSAINSKLRNENRLLVAQRELMLTQDQMETAAHKLGLRSPAKNQIRYP